MTNTAKQHKAEVCEKMRVLLLKWSAILENQDASMAQVNFLATQIDAAGRELDAIKGKEKEGI